MMQERDLKTDVLVAGGGAAGVPCALAAARCGARVILCQDRPVLGGNASSEVRMHIVGADASGARGAELATEARESGIIEEIRLETSVRNPQRSASMLDLVLYDLCRAEPNLTLLLNTAVVGVHKDGVRIASCRAERQSSEEAFDIRARVFVDCTGDGRLGAEAGAPYRQGREGHEEYGESRARDQADPETLGSTLLFMARRHEQPMPFRPPLWARKFSEEDLRLRPHARAGVDRGLEYGYWWAEWGGQLDTITDNETIRDELLAIMMGIWDHIKNGGDHGAENWALDWFGFLPGKRESRRFIGAHVLSEQDVWDSRPMPDAIAFGGWPIDTHPPEGVDAPGDAPCKQDAVPHVYDIPLRTCVCEDLPNLMFAGRNISATHVAFASTRVMATCAAVGQGVGVSAALGAAWRVDPVRLPGDAAAIGAIQQRLLRDDAYLIGQRNTDPADLARQARVTASSHQPGGEPGNVLSGQTRAVHGEHGALPERANPGTHRWMSQPEAGFPAWLQLTWTSPVTFREIRVVFDTGLHRPLTLTHSDAYAARMAWGRPQPETVAEYRIEALVEESWVLLLKESGNYQRLRVHLLPDIVKAGAIRVTVLATNGLDHARIVEVRIYGGKSTETPFPA